MKALPMPTGSQGNTPEEISLLSSSTFTSTQSFTLIAPIKRDSLRMKPLSGLPDLHIRKGAVDTGQALRAADRGQGQGLCLAGSAEMRDMNRSAVTA